MSRLNIDRVLNALLLHEYFFYSVALKKDLDTSTSTGYQGKEPSVYVWIKFNWVAEETCHKAETFFPVQHSVFKSCSSSLVTR